MKKKCRFRPILFFLFICFVPVFVFSEEIDYSKLPDDYVLVDNPKDNTKYQKFWLDFVFYFKDKCVVVNLDESSGNIKQIRIFYIKKDDGFVIATTDNYSNNYHLENPNSFYIDDTRYISLYGRMKKDGPLDITIYLRENRFIKLGRDITKLGELKKKIEEQINILFTSN